MWRLMMPCCMPLTLNRWLWLPPFFSLPFLLARQPVAWYCALVVSFKLIFARSSLLAGSCDSSFSTTSTTGGGGGTPFTRTLQQNRLRFCRTRERTARLHVGNAQRTALSRSFPGFIF